MSDIPLSADDPVLTTVALIRAALDNDMDRLLQLWADTEDKFTVVIMLTSHAQAAISQLGGLLETDPHELLDYLIRHRLDLEGKEGTR